jgi:hypothetical protein
MKRSILVLNAAVVLLISHQSFAVEVESCQMLGDISAFMAQMRDSGMSYDSYAKFINKNFKKSKYLKLYLEGGKDVFVKNNKKTPAQMKDEIRTLCNYQKSGVYDDKEK